MFNATALILCCPKSEMFRLSWSHFTRFLWLNESKKAIQVSVNYDLINLVILVKIFNINRHVGVNWTQVPGLQVWCLTMPQRFLCWLCFKQTAIPCLAMHHWLNHMFAMMAPLSRMSVTHCNCIDIPTATIRGPSIHNIIMSFYDS